MHKMCELILFSVPKNYNLVVIEDGRIPLVETLAGDSQMWLQAAGMLVAVIMLITMIFLYITACEWTQRRIRELEARYEQRGYKGWNFVRLTREVGRLEMEAVSRERLFQKSWTEMDREGVL